MGKVLSARTLCPSRVVYSPSSSPPASSFVYDIADCGKASGYGYCEGIVSVYPWISCFVCFAACASSNAFQDYAQMRSCWKS